MESFVLARDQAYGMLPSASADGVYALPPEYTDAATSDVGLQLGKAGIRLASLLNRMLATTRGVGH
jgi:hypothetical protein